MNKRKIITLVCLIIFVGLLIDLLAPIKHDFKQFDPVRVGTSEAAMWRSYYERKPLQLFFQLSTLMRTQFGAPFARSFIIAYHAARAAFIFKDGLAKKDYEKALPPLILYFEKLNHLAKDTFDVHKIARQELQWWIIRRDVLSYTAEDWKIILAMTFETMYHIPANRFGTFADQRVRAMLYRDSKGNAILEEDWVEIEKRCIGAWTSCQQILRSSLRQG